MLSFCKLYKENLPVPCCLILCSGSPHQFDFQETETEGWTPGSVALQSNQLESLFIKKTRHGNDPGPFSVILYSSVTLTFTNHVFRVNYMFFTH